MGACYLLYEEDGSCICITSLPEPWAVIKEERPTDATIFGSQIATRLANLRNGLTEAGEQGEIEVATEGGGVFQFRCRKVMIPRQGIYFILAIADKTEERQREKVLKSLLLEVSHRSKNLLAIVQGIASQTARFTDSLDGFLQKFRGRLYALSQSQDIVTASSWQGAAFRELLDAQISRYVVDNPGAIEIRGEDILLSPNAATHVGLALHELIVNAIAHGELIRRASRIEVSCNRVDTLEGPQIRLIWMEHFVEPRLEAATQDDQFASTVLQRVVPAAVNGAAQYIMDEHGVSYELVFPAEARG